jgi:hypothetical protein
LANIGFAGGVRGLRGGGLAVCHGVSVPDLALGASRLTGTDGTISGRNGNAGAVAALPV